MKILLFGKNGQLGWEFQQLLPRLGEVIAVDREELDLANPEMVRSFLLEVRPDLVVNASAYTDVDGAEAQTELAMNINAVSPGVMAEVARQIGAGLIHYSTDYVFDGRAARPYAETDPTNPLNMYGKSKLAGEQAVQAAGEAYVIFRTSWVYSLRGNGFVNKVLGWARKNTTLKVVNDQIGNPTWARMLAETTLQVLTAQDVKPLNILREKCGLYHLTGAGFTSRFEWAKEILARDPNRTEQLIQAIEPASSSDFPTPAERPLFSALDCSKFSTAFHITLPDWRESLQTAMQG